MSRPDRPSAFRPQALSLLAAAALAAGCGPPSPVAQLEVTPGQVELAYPGRASLTLYWTPTAPLSGKGPIVFVHLLSASGKVERTFDHPLPFNWTVGTSAPTTVALWQSALGPALAPGTYDLTLGLYDPASGKRFPLATAGRAVDGGEYAVAAVTVPAAAGAATASFTGSWLPVEPTGDRQTFANRWLQGDGAIEIAGLSQPVVAEATLEVPAAEGLAGRLALDEGAGEAAVMVSSPCAAGEPAVFHPGDGLRTVALRLDPAGAAACRIEIDASYQIVLPASLERRTVALRTLTWNG